MSAKHTRAAMEAAAALCPLGQLKALRKQWIEDAATIIDGRFAALVEAVGNVIGHKKFNCTRGFPQLEEGYLPSCRMDNLPINTRCPQCSLVDQFEALRAVKGD